MSRVCPWKLIVSDEDIRNCQGKVAPTNPRFGVNRVGKFLYVTGGLGELNLELPTTPTVGVLDIYRKEWRWIEYAGSLLSEPKLFLYNDGVFAFCRGDWSDNWSGKVSRFDLCLEAWSYCHVQGLGPGYREGCTGDYLEEQKRFVVFAGKNIDGEELNDVHVLAMPGCRWVEPKVKGRSPGVRYRHSSCVYDGVLYYFGGVVQNMFCWDGMFVLRMEQGDVVTWSSIQATENRFHAHSAAMIAFNGKILLCGGAYVNKSKCIVYDPREEEFEKAGISSTDLQRFERGGSAFLIEKGKSFGVFGGGGRINRYTHVERKA